MIDELTKAEAAYQKSKHKEGYKSFYQVYAKRAIDIVGSITALPFVLIVALPISAAIKVEDHGPLFYRSMRLGLG